MRRMKEPPFGEAVKAWVKSPPGPPTARKFTLARCHARLSIWVDGDGVQYGWDELVDPEPYQKGAFFAYVEELRDYWVAGPGAAKIKWGIPADATVWCGEAMPPRESLQTGDLWNQPGHLTRRWDGTDWKDWT